VKLSRHRTKSSRAHANSQILFRLFGIGPNSTVKFNARIGFSETQMLALPWSGCLIPSHAQHIPYVVSTGRPVVHSTGDEVGRRDKN
jgi:hypothetical protein